MSGDAFVSTRGRVRIVAFVAGTTAACAGVLGIQDTTDEEPALTVDADVARDAIAPDADLSPVEPPPLEDGGGYADVAELDVQIAPCTEDGLVARWKLDEDGGDVAGDCSGNMLHGLITRGTHTDGIDGGGLLFSNGWVGFSNPSKLRITGALTLAAWVRSDRAIPDTEYLLGKTASPATRGWRLAVLNNRTLAFAAPSKTNAVNAVGGNVPIGKWAHVAGVFRPGVVAEAYLNGLLVGSRTANVPQTTVDTTDEVRIASRADGTSTFGGAVDDVRIYDRALSATEIAALAKR